MKQFEAQQKREMIVIGSMIEHMATLTASDPEIILSKLKDYLFTQDEYRFIKEYINYGDRNL